MKRLFLFFTLLSFLLSLQVISCGSGGQGSSSDNSNGNNSQNQNLTTCPLNGLRSGIDYVPAKLIVLTPFDGRSEGVKDVVTMLGGNIKIYSSLLGISSPQDSESHDYAAFPFDTQSSRECSTLDVLRQTTNVNGVCYLSSSTTAACFWVVNQTFWFDQNIGERDRDGDLIPDVMDNCVDVSNFNQVKNNPSDVFGAACAPDNIGA